MKKKLIILISLLIILSGCKIEEAKCPEPEKIKEQKEEISIKCDAEEILINYDNKQITTKEALEATKEHTFTILFENIKLDILKEEMKDYQESGEDYVEKTIDQMKSVYGSSFEETIKSSTSYTSIEEYKKYILLSYLENEYVKQYISQKENIEYEEITDDKTIKYYQKYYVKSLKDLLKKYNVEFTDKDYEKMYKKYIKEIEDYYNKQ